MHTAPMPFPPRKCSLLAHAGRHYALSSRDHFRASVVDCDRIKKLQVTEDGATVYEATVDTPLPTMSTVGGLHMSVDKALAKKFKSAHLQKEHEHLNVRFDAGLLPDSKGIFAEMAGVHEMSEATAALMTPPNQKGSSVNALQP